MLGAAPKTNKRAIVKLKKRYPELSIDGYSSSFSYSVDEEIKK